MPRICFGQSCFGSRRFENGLATASMLIDAGPEKGVVVKFENSGSLTGLRAAEFYLLGIICN
jgi:hypothetical protein